MEKTNVVLFDCTEKETVDFITGLQESTGMAWQTCICRSNGSRKNKLANAKRYLLYFIYPFKIFLHRKQYARIIGWQEFYGLVYAFYCRLFHVRKCNELVIKNFIYKPKKGFVGKIYHRFMHYIVTSPYIDVCICASQANCDLCAETFQLDRSKFHFIPFGVMDFAKDSYAPLPQKDFVLSLGRSNRDWDLLIEAMRGAPYQTQILCDELNRDKQTDNIIIHNDVYGDETYRYIAACRCMVIPIANGRVASGDTVLIKAMQFGKPVIVTSPSCLADDYVDDGINGLVTAKNPADIRAAVDRLYHDSELNARLGANARKTYEERFSLLQYARNVGALFTQGSRNGEAKA